MRDDVERIERKAKQLADENRDPNWWNYKAEAKAALLSVSYGQEGDCNG